MKLNLKIKKLVQITWGLLLLILLSSSTFAQKGSSPFKKIYLQGGFGGASRNGLSAELNIQAVIKNKWVASIAYQNIEATPKNLPGDYEGDVFIFFPIDLTPNTNLNLFSITAGKYFSTGKRTWITTEGGITFGNGEKMTFTHTDPQFFIIGKTSNYDYTTEKKNLAGVMLRADFNWAFASFMGLGANVYVNINSIQSPVGFNLKLLVGKMGIAKNK